MTFQRLVQLKVSIFEQPLGARKFHKTLFLCMKHKIPLVTLKGIIGLLITNFLLYISFFKRVTAGPRTQFINHETQQKSTFSFTFPYRTYRHTPLTLRVKYLINLHLLGIIKLLKFKSHFSSKKTYC